MRGLATPSLILVLASSPQPLLADTTTESPAPSSTESPAPSSSVSYNMALSNHYVFRGLAQTANHPAVSGGADYQNANGLYAGTWLSSVSWLRDGHLYEQEDIEWDIYGGYRHALSSSNFTYDIGMLQYIYPGRPYPGIKRAETTEAYGALSYNWLQGKLSYVVSDGAFTSDDATGSYYTELNASLPVKNGFSALAHIGRQKYVGETGGVGNDIYSCVDWKMGISKSLPKNTSIGGILHQHPCKKPLCLQQLCRRAH